MIKTCANCEHFIEDTRYKKVMERNVSLPVSEPTAKTIGFGPFKRTVLTQPPGTFSQKDHDFFVGILS